MILIFTLILPQAAALPSRLVGWNPLDYSTSGIGHTATFLVPMTIVAIAVGLWWNPEVWLKSALLFYGIFTLFYTTFFTNGLGFFSGLVGSLGYWLSQQAVQRGSQPGTTISGKSIYEFLLPRKYYGCHFRATQGGGPQLSTHPEHLSWSRT
jgi:hypothetical protein